MTQFEVIWWAMRLATLFMAIAAVLLPILIMRSSKDMSKRERMSWGIVWGFMLMTGGVVALQQDLPLLLTDGSTGTTKAFVDTSGNWQGGLSGVITCSDSPNATATIAVSFSDDNPGVSTVARTDYTILTTTVGLTSSDDAVNDVHTGFSIGERYLTGFELVNPALHGDEVSAFWWLVKGTATNDQATHATALQDDGSSN